MDRLLKIIPLLIGLSFSSLTYAVSFDCKKASTASEYAICNNQVLSNLDDQLAIAYRNARSAASNPDQLKNEQVAWLGTIRACNGDAVCIEKAYRQRISVLSPNSSTQSSSSNLAPCQGGNTSAWNQCFGTKNYPTGDRYVGDWVGGKASGQGTYTSRASAAMYTGQFFADTFSGAGTMTWTNGAKFVGQWKNDAGVTGTVTYANGTTAVGTVRNAIFYAAAQQPRIVSNQPQSTPQPQTSAQKTSDDSEWTGTIDELSTAVTRLARHIKMAEDWLQTHPNDEVIKADLKNNLETYHTLNKELEMRTKAQQVQSKPAPAPVGRVAGVNIDEQGCKDFGASIGSMQHIRNRGGSIEMATENLQNLLRSEDFGSRQLGVDMLAMAQHIWSKPPNALSRERAEQLGVATCNKHYRS